MSVTEIELLLMDVDGVLTDGSIWMDDTGQQLKRFDVRDGLGIRAWQRCGLEAGILTSRSSRALAHRAAELGIGLIEQGAADKMIGLENICRRQELDEHAVAYVGDDLPDLGVMCRVGYPIAVADACEEIRQVASFVTQARGGHGAVREAIEHLLRAMGRWEEVLDFYGP